MYAVVGCNECNGIWVVEGRPETSQCPKCGKRHQFDRLRNLYETDDAEEAKQARGELLAKQQDLGDAFDDLDSYSEMGDRIGESTVGDDRLESMGLGSDLLESAGRASGSGEETSKSQPEIVREAISTLEDPAQSDIVEYAAERGVSGMYTQKALESMVESGEVTKNGDTYRLL